MLKKDTILYLSDNGLNVFKYYIGGEWRVGKNFRNPFYDDKKGSFNIFKDRNGIYQMKDFGNETFSGDCFALVGLLHGLDCSNTVEFVQIMRRINADLSLGLNDNMDKTEPMMQQSRSKFAITPESHKESEKERKSRPYSIKEQPFREAEKNYWAEYGIDKRTLERYRVVSLANFSSENSEGQPYNFRSTTNEPIFGYQSDEFIKIYRPKSSVKFLYGGDLGETYCFGLEQLPAKGDMVFITGGEKDVLSLATRGFSAISFNSETATISEQIIESLYHRFKHIIVLYDMDKTGINSSIRVANELKNYEVKRMELPLSGEKTEKDISDYFKIGYTRKDFLSLFVLLLDKLYNSTMTMLSSCEIDYSNPPERTADIVSIANVPLGTGGNLLGITGGEGTGKSCYVASLVAGAISNGTSDIDSLGATIAPNLEKKAVLLYDTEQSDTQLHKNLLNLLRRANVSKSPEEFRAYSLTAMSRKERLKAIVQSMDRFYYEYDGIHLVVVDGIADLVRCANDEAESIAVVEELYRLAGIYNTCIICVLHFVPNGLKLRGHLGSEMQRKAAAILSIEADKDPSISVVKALKVREGSALDIPLMQFSWDKEKAMHIYLGEKSEKDRIKRKKHDIGKICDDVFSLEFEYTYTDLGKAIQLNASIGERTAAEYIKEMMEEGLIQKNNSKRYTRVL